MTIVDLLIERTRIQDLGVRIQRNAKHNTEGHRGTEDTEKTQN
jgi:hypothetical protein